MNELNPYSSKIQKVLNECNYWYAKLLGLEPKFYNGNFPSQLKYGLNFPRSLTTRTEVFGGFQRFTYTFDVLYLFTVPLSENLNGAIAASFLEVQSAISLINERIAGGSWSGMLRPGDAWNSTVSQRREPPHVWEVSIIGEALLDLYIYRRSDGVPVTYPHC